MIVMGLSSCCYMPFFDMSVAIFLFRVSLIFPFHIENSVNDITCLFDVYLVNRDGMSPSQER